MEWVTSSGLRVFGEFHQRSTRLRVIVDLTAITCVEECDSSGLYTVIHLPNGKHQVTEPYDKVVEIMRKAFGDRGYGAHERK